MKTKKEEMKDLVWFGFIGYLRPKPVDTYIRYIWCVNISQQS